MEKRYKVVPRRGCYIPGILPDGRHIISTIILNNLNQRELIACMRRASVYALVNGKEIHISTPNIKDAEKLFNEIKTVIKDVVSIKPVEQVDSSDEYKSDNEQDQISIDEDTSIDLDDTDEAVEDEQADSEINTISNESETASIETEDNDQLEINDTEHTDNERIEKNLEQPSPTEKNNRGGNSQKNNNHYNKPRRREYKK